MEINWITFVLEIFNFLILLWILKRFLYVPIKNIILARKETVEKELENASSQLQEAQTLQKKYENRLTDWEKAKEAKKLELQHDIDKEKAKQMDNLKKMLEKEKEKNTVLIEQQITDKINKARKESIRQAVEFAASLLSQLSDNNLEKKIIELFINSFQGFSTEQIAELKEKIGEYERPIKIKTAFELNNEQKTKLSKLFERLFNEKFKFKFECEPNLLAGAYIELNSVIFHLNLRDELSFFSETLAHE